MPNVRMLVEMSGGRYDGRPWPGYKGVIGLPDWEATDLVTNHIAEYTDAPELVRGYDVLKAPALDYETYLSTPDGGELPEVAEEDERPAVPVSANFDDDFDRDEEEPVAEPVTEQVKKPYSNASKADWIHYAISRGEKRETAVGMTRTDLIEKYSA